MDYDAPVTKPEGHSDACSRSPLTSPQSHAGEAVTPPFTIRPWDVLYNQRWDQHAARISDALAETERRGPRALSHLAPQIVDLLIARGEKLRESVAPLAPVTTQAMDSIAREAERGSLTFVELAKIDLLGTLASLGIDMPARAFDDARTILSAVQTRRDVEHVYYHWARGLAAIALDWPQVYRGLLGSSGRDLPPFIPGATFAGNMHGLLTHLAAAVEARARAADVKPAWDELVAEYFPLQGASMVHAACLFWASWIIHHKLGGEPIATLGEALHVTIWRAAGVEP